jgi:hypothetical protein
LALALLYHVGLDEESSYHPYLTLLEATPMESIPHLWDSATLRHSATVGVRKVAKGIQKDVQDLYETIVMVLVEEHPDVFGRPSTAFRNSEDEDEHEDSEDDDIDDEADWLFSRERFHWAFAIVNSRHWHLPIPKEQQQPQPQQEPTTYDNHLHDEVATPTITADGETSESTHFSEQAAPPAAMPTEDWLDLQREEHRKEEENSVEAQQQQQHGDTEYDDNFWPSGNSFLAPVADLLNFGPPCTRGVYNTETESFEIIATCQFQKGQEVTFWYADACQDVFVANYGFTHPMMVPKCQDDESRIIHQLEHELMFAVEELEFMDRELDAAMHVLSECDCVKEQQQQQQQQQQHPQQRQEQQQQQKQPASSSSRKGRVTLHVPAAVPSPPKNSILQQQNARHAIRGGKQKDGLGRGTTARKQRVTSRKSDL